MRSEVLPWRSFAIVLCLFTGLYLHAAAPAITNIVMVPRLAIAGDLNTASQVQYSQDLGQPTNWTALSDIVITQSPYYFADLSTPTNQRFYRVISLTNVPPGSAVTLVVSGASSQTAGVAGSVTVTARDANNNIATNYTGTVHFTSTDANSPSLPANYTFTGADAGTHTFSATLKTAGSQTITATDTGNGSLTGTSSTITVTPAAAATLTVITSAGNPQTAGLPFTVTVTARDAYGNKATNYAGTVSFNSTDTNSALPGNYAFTGADIGSHTFAAILKTAGNRTITATDSGNSIIGTSSSITVNPAATATFTVTASSPQTAGSSFNFTVTAKDAYGNTTTGYGGIVHFTFTDGAAVFYSGDSPLFSGTGSFSVTLKTAGPQTITATDTVNSSLTGTSSTITVTPAAAATFTVTASSPQTAGYPFNFTVTAKDAYGNTATNYAGTVHFTSTDTNISSFLPSNSTLTSGTKTFTSGAYLTAAGSQTITATDTVNGSITGTSPIITVSPTYAATFTVTTTVNSSQTAGSAFSITVTAKDPYGNVATGYSGTVAFSSSDALATLPGNSTLVNGTGTKTFSSAVTLKTAGSQTITATDTGNSSLHGTSPGITITPAAAATFTVTASSPQTAGSAFSVTVTAKDAYGNTATNYAGAVTFSSSDVQAVLPANSTLVNGTKTFSSGVTLKTAGNQTITATDSVIGGITGTSSTVTVTPAAAATLTVTTTASNPQSHTMSFSVTVTAKDTYGNTATGYGGTVHFTSTDNVALLPADSTLTSGTKTFSFVQLRTTGTQTISATDTVSSSITGTSPSINVGP